MKTIVIVLMLFFAKMSFADDSVISFDSHLNSCSRLLKSKRSLRDNEVSKSILIFNLLDNKPPYVSSRDFFRVGDNPEELFVFKGLSNPTFGSTGVEEWFRLDNAQLDFRNDLYFIRRDSVDNDLYTFTEHTRFRLDEVEIAFVEILDFFKSVSRTFGRESGADYVSLFNSLESKDRMRVMLSAWALGASNQRIDEFVYSANQIIGDPSFLTSDPRSTRAYFNKIVDAFRAHFGKMSGFNYKYEKMLDSLERRRLLHYYLLL